MVGRCRSQFAQVVLCKGCCCGQTERKRPAVPVDELKAIWKDEKLSRSVQLTVSGCVGPCQMANVVMVLTPSGALWLGPLRDNADYTAIVEWVRACHAEQRLTSLPPSLRGLAFERFGPE
ncbi:MAG: (2Fe-2S) ferredoxin domain-containing protein [Pyrinomonadaceae bacterium]|nr:(2Fe-2S) ferredoxin domain-containing protein [Phycisphaerales bacterium]